MSKILRPFRPVAVALFALVLGGFAANAQTISFADGMERFQAACGADLAQHCPGVSLGGGEVQSCLRQNEQKLSAVCVSTYVAVFQSLQQRMAAQAAAPEVCKSDIRRLCSNFRQGQARILRCLIRPDNARKASRKCNAAITEAGWR